MTPLNAKLFRDLWHIRGQVLAIALVIAGGVAALVMSLGTLLSLQESRHAYYDRQRFADVFVHAKRAPNQVIRELQEIEGVARAESRIVEEVILDMPGMDAPARGRVVSIDIRDPERLNRTYLRRGRDLRPDHPDEVLLHEAFAQAHGLEPGSRIDANINGHRRQLSVVGVALSPEFTYAIGPGEIVPDDKRFAVLWMDREALEAAFDLNESFNAAAFSVSRGASIPEVIRRIDAVLAKYGGTGAIGRKDQLSDAFLSSEIDQLRTLAQIVPPIFLAVAAFLLHIVITRLIQTEREQIGLLKAFGYSNARIGLHYARFIAAIALTGIAIGWVAGASMGHGVTRLYTEFFRLPVLYYRLNAGVFGLAALISLLAAATGTFTSLRRAATIPPAVAMQPPPPTAYRGTVMAWIGRLLGLSEPGRMIVRHILRWPVRSVLTLTGIAFAVAILIGSMFFIGAVDTMTDRFFFDNERQDMSLSFAEIRPDAVRHALDRLPGVLAAETYRVVPVSLEFGSRSERVSIQGIRPGAGLSRLTDRDGIGVELPPGGIVLSDRLARLLAARQGDIVTVRALEGRRVKREVPVTLVVRQYVGVTAYMDQRALNRLMGEGPVVSAANLRVDPAAERALYEEIKQMPAIVGLGIRRAALETFRGLMQEHLNTMIFFYIGFASLIAVGVVYNSARISLSERGRELASLRVLGFTRTEVSLILVGELCVLTLLALPVGCLLGYGLASLMVTLFDTDLYRIPLVVTGSTYGYAMLVVLGASACSAGLVVRRLGRLDLVAVLKTRE